MRRFKIQQSVRSTRSGFTIVELLMVIGILLFLIATSAFVVRNIGNKAREKATMASIVKINGLLTQRIQAFQKYLESARSNKEIEAKIYKNYAIFTDSMTQPYLGNKARAISRPVMEILAKKDLFRENFPQIPGENTDVDDLIDGVDNGGTPNPDANLSAEYLYFILTKHDAYGISPVGEDAFSASEVGDTDGDGLKEFVDGWGRPLRFYRWPTHLIRPGGAGIDRRAASILFSSLPPAPSVGNEQDPLSVDPDDPLGRLKIENTRQGNLLTPLIDTSSNFQPYKYATFDTFWMPLIVSAGEDGILALFEPNDVLNYGVLGQPTAIPPVEGIFDNLTNHNQRAGGR